MRSPLIQITPGAPLGCAAAAFGAALLLGSGAAVAEPSPRDAVTAEALFRAGRDLVAAGNHAEGCPKFEASFALDPSTGTLLNIAKCHEHDGKLASAWEDYTRALVLSGEVHGAERRKTLEGIAKQAIAALEPRLPRLRIVVPYAPPGLKVLRDGKELPAAALGDTLPADPGPHQVSAVAPGYRTTTRSVTLAEGKTETIELALVAGSDAGAEGGASPGSDREAPARGGAPVWAWVTGGAGVALAGVGAFFLSQDLAAIGALRDNCFVYPTGGSSCKPGYDPKADNARKDLSLGLAIGLGGAGVVAMGAALVVIVRAPSAHKQAATASVSAAPWFAPGGAGIAVHGGF